MRITLSDRNPTDVQTVWFSGYESMLAGAGAGLVTSVLTCPLDVVKTKLQASGAGTRPSRGIIGEPYHPVARLVRQRVPVSRARAAPPRLARAC